MPNAFAVCSCVNCVPPFKPKRMTSMEYSRFDRHSCMILSSLSLTMTFPPA